VPDNSQFVVLVDDSEPIRFALGELLTIAGYTVMAAENGRQAIGLLDGLARANRQPDAVIADLVMDELTGYDVIKHAKRTFPTVPVIAISGGTPSVPPDLSLDLAQRSGADLSLRKPFPNDTLLDNLQRLIDQSREGRRPKS
jgi:CheY-like chemotaxis protein